MMTSENEFEDRRTHTRFKPRYGAYAAVMSDYRKLGLIKDISMGGLSFSYIPQEGTHTPKSYKMIIGFGIDNKALKDVPFKTVMDVEEENKISFSSIPLRKMRVEFEKMSLQQKTEVDYFIQNCTQKEA